MEKRIRHVTFYGSSYEFALLQEGLMNLPGITLQRLESNPLETPSDLLFLGHPLPGTPCEALLKGRVVKRGPKAVISIAHGPFPQHWLPSPLDPTRGVFSFRWVCDVKLASHLLQLVENHLYADYYYEEQHRRFLLLLEDEISYASFFVPIILKELRERTLSLVPDPLKHTQRHAKELQERPVLLLASSFEQACIFLDKYGDRMVGVVSSLGFPKGGSNDLQAGFHLIERVKSLPTEIPVVIQTSQHHMRSRVKAAGASFMDKSGPRMLQLLREYLLEYFGFGDFIFRMPDRDNTVVAKATTLVELLQCLEWIPLDSFVYHASRRHFSNWLGVHGYLQLAETVRPLIPDHTEAARRELIALLTPSIP